MSKVKLKLEERENGFVVWDTAGKSRRWVLDASTIIKDGSFRFAGTKFKNTAKARDYKEYSLKEGFKNV